MKRLTTIVAVIDGILILGLLWGLYIWLASGNAPTWIAWLFVGPLLAIGAFTALRAIATGKWPTDPQA